MTDSNGNIQITTTFPPADHTYGVTASGFQDASGTVTTGLNSGGHFIVRLNPAGIPYEISDSNVYDVDDFAQMLNAISFSQQSTNIATAVTVFRPDVQSVDLIVSDNGTVEFKGRTGNVFNFKVLSLQHSA